MKIIFNGNVKEIPTELPLAQFINSQCSENNKKIAVALNDSIIPAHEWINTELKEGDRIEALIFAAGG